MTTDKLGNALAFAKSDVHDGDKTQILAQALVACKTLADEVERLRAFLRRHHAALAGRHYDPKWMDQLAAEAKRP